MVTVTKLIIIRHGQTDYNLEHKLDGQYETQLTKEGVSQAKKLSRFLKSYTIDSVYSSPLSRTLDTAKIIMKELSLSRVQIVEEFKEIDCGLCTGLTKKEIKKTIPELVEKWKSNTDPPFPRGESLEDVEKRAIPILKKIIRSQKGKTILLIGHGSLNIAILGYFLRIPYGLRFKIKQSNCCVNEIDFNDDLENNFTINKINFTV